MNLCELRSVLTESARVAHGRGRTVVTAQHVADATDKVGPQLSVAGVRDDAPWRGQLYLQVLTARGDDTLRPRRAPPRAARSSRAPDLEAAGPRWSPTTGEAFPAQARIGRLVVECASMRGLRSRMRVRSAAARHLGRSARGCTPRASTPCASGSPSSRTRCRSPASSTCRSPTDRRRAGAPAAGRQRDEPRVSAVLEKSPGSVSRWHGGCSSTSGSQAGTTFLQTLISHNRDRLRGGRAAAGASTRRTSRPAASFTRTPTSIVADRGRGAPGPGWWRGRRLGQHRRGRHEFFAPPAPTRRPAPRPHCAPGPRRRPRSRDTEPGHRTLAAARDERLDGTDRRLPGQRQGHQPRRSDCGTLDLADVLRQSGTDLPPDHVHVCAPRPDQPQHTLCTTLRDPARPRPAGFDTSRPRRTSRSASSRSSCCAGSTPT